MTTKWFELVKKRLDPEDQVQKSYRARYDNTDGWFVMSNKKLLFVEEKGFLRTTYSFVQEIPYEKVDKIAIERNQLVLTEVGGGKHVFTSDYMRAIESSLKGLIESALSKVIA